MIARRGQGFAGEVSGSHCDFVQGSLQVVEFFAFLSCLLSVEPFPFLLVGFQGGDK
jgi:hypothetical protein